MTAQGCVPLLVAVFAAAEPVTTVPLRIEYPKPAFVGTPKHVPAGTTVDAAPRKPPPPLQVPAGTRNLARGRPVTASQREAVTGEPDLVTDGDKEAEGGAYLELGRGLQWVQVDLGKPCLVHAVALWHEHGSPVVYRDVVVRCAEDADFLVNARTLFNNDRDNSAGFGVGTDREYFETNRGKLIAVPAVRARFVRCYSNGNTGDEFNRVTEVEVYGTPAR